MSFAHSFSPGGEPKKIKYPKGSRVKCLNDCYGSAPAFTKGTIYTVREHFYETSKKDVSVKVVVDDNGSHSNGWGPLNFEAYPKKRVKKVKAPVPMITIDTRAPTVLGTQVGGSHYTDCAIQPIEYIWANGLGFSEGNIVKYVTRWKTKGGLKDLEKAKHHIALLIEYETTKGTK